MRQPEKRVVVPSVTCCISGNILISVYWKQCKIKFLTMLHIEFTGLEPCHVRYRGEIRSLNTQPITARDGPDQLANQSSSQILACLRFTNQSLWIEKLGWTAMQFGIIHGGSWWLSALQEKQLSGWELPTHTLSLLLGLNGSKLNCKSTVCAHF